MTDQQNAQAAQRALRQVGEAGCEASAISVNPHDLRQHPQQRPIVRTPPPGTDMNDQVQTLPFTRYVDAMNEVRSFADPAREQFVMRAVTIMLNDYGAGNVAESPIDLLYMVSVLSKLFDEREALLRILAGEDLRGFD